VAEGAALPAGRRHARFSAFDAGHRAVQRGNVDLAHRHHRCECACRRFATLCQQLGEAARRDLP
jgi:hypothetical protein